MIVPYCCVHTIHYIQLLVLTSCDLVYSAYIMMIMITQVVLDGQEATSKEQVILTIGTIIWNYTSHVYANIPNV